MRGTEGAQEPPSQEPNTLLPSRSSARLRGSSTSLNLRRSTRRTSAGSVLTSATTEATAAATTTRKRKKTSSSRMSSSERLVSEPTATEEGSGAAKETRATTVAPPAASSDKSTSNPLNNKATKKKKTKASSVKKPRVVEERELLGEMEHYKDNVDSDDDEHAFYTADMDPEADSKQYGEDEEENEEEEEEDEEDMMGQGNGGFMANFSRILQGRTAPTSQARPSGRFGRILTVLESTGRVDEKLATLGELSEFLSMATGKCSVHVPPPTLLCKLFRGHVPWICRCGHGIPA